MQITAQKIWLAGSADAPPCKPVVLRDDRILFWQFDGRTTCTTLDGLHTTSWHKLHAQTDLLVVTR